MYNKIKCNFIDETCPCEYVVSKDEKYTHDYIDVEIYIGEGLENIEARASCQSYSEEWVLPEVVGENGTGYLNGWYSTRLRYSDFSKCADDDHWIYVHVYANGVKVGDGGGSYLYIYHEGLSGEFSTNPVNVTKSQVGSILNSYKVIGIGSSGGSGGSGGGGGGTTYTAGNGIDISGNEIKTKIDNSTIRYDSDGRMYAQTESGLTIDKAVVITQADSAYILHNYTEIAYINGNKVVYAGAQNQIIAGGMIIYKRGGVAPNGIVISASSKTYSMASIAECGLIVPNPPLYSNYNFPQSVKNYSSSTSYYYVNSFTLEHDKSTTDFDSYIGYANGEGGKTKVYSLTNYFGFEGYGMFFVWEELYAPGSTVAGETWEFGCVKCTMYIKYRNTNSSNGNANVRVTSYDSGKWYFPFISIAEYNAAVCLTYEPINSITVIDKVTGG